ncbi:hypothetical protein NQ318_003298 [Aromia moschata]|uniref:Uncharacterized protein n=1 Tax=Aromia moschata TaxID=1265417 RepID=A0AAV8YP92_9CUCU|nr:hypothetical protein NQ318_003298 [Aromia moschata]
MHYNVTTALELFARSRPPGIYRENYIKELYRRYGAVADILPTPPLPQWVEEKTRTRERKRFNEDR